MDGYYARGNYGGSISPLTSPSSSGRSQGFLEQQQDDRYLSNANLSYGERRQLVRDLRLAATRASIGPPRPMRNPPPMPPPEVGPRGGGQPYISSTIDQYGGGKSQLDLYEERLRQQQQLHHRQKQQQLVKQQEPIVQKQVTEIHHHHHHHYYNNSPLPLVIDEDFPATQFLSSNNSSSRLQKSPLRVVAKRKTTKKQPVEEEEEEEEQQQEISQKVPPPRLIMAKAQELLNKEKNKKKKDSTSSRMSMEQKKQPLKKQERQRRPSYQPPTEPRKRTRSASVVLNEVQAETVRSYGNSFADLDDDDNKSEEEEVDESELENVEEKKRDYSSSQGFVFLAEASHAKPEQEEKQEYEDEQNAPIVADEEDEEDEGEEEEQEEPGKMQEVLEKRGAKLLTMLEQAEMASQEVQSNQNMALIPFGDVLAQKMKNAKPGKDSTLPRHASTRETNPMRPPPQVKHEEVTFSSNRYRSYSQGAEPPKTPVTKEGWLLKKPNPNRWLGESSQPVWKYRYFKLTNDMLMYMVNPEQRPKRVLKLSQIEIETDPRRMGMIPTVHSMIIYQKNKPKSKFHVCAESFKEILEWYRAIVTNAVYFCFNLTSTRPPRDYTPLTPAQKLLLKEKREKARMPKPKPPKPEEFYPLYERPASHYDVLGVPADAPLRQIKKSYYKLAQKYHPDKNPDVNPHEFTMLSQAWDVLSDENMRIKYDLGEKIKEVLRRGFDCTLYVPTKFRIDGKRKIPIELGEKQVTLFSDGDINRLFFQPAVDDEYQPLQPDNQNSLELRFVQRVVYGRNVRIIYETFIRPNLSGDLNDIDAMQAQVKEMDTIIALQGSKLDHEWFIKLDTTESTKEMVDGLRIIRCEASVLFAQTLEKLLAEGLE